MSMDPTAPLDPGPDTAAAQAKVNGPAIALMVLGGLNVLLSLYGIVSNAMTLAAPEAAIEIQGEGFENIEGFDPQMFTKFVQGAGALGIVLNIVAIAISAVIILGALKMKKLEGRGMAMASAILAMIPCLSPCCILGLPFGIWALVAMNSPEVKASFH